MYSATKQKDYLAIEAYDFFTDYDPYGMEDSGAEFFAKLIELAPKELLYQLQQIVKDLEAEQDAMLVELRERAEKLGYELEDFVGIEHGTEVGLDEIMSVEYDEPDNRPRLFVDMDGTLAKFNEISSEEQLYERGYFANLEPQMDVVNAVKGILEDKSMDVYILSAVFMDSMYALNEKNEWLDAYLPEIDTDHRVFVPCGQEKAQYIPHGIQKGDILLDDYSKNLHEWPKDGVAIKLMNGINGTKGTWKGPFVDLYDGSQGIRHGIEKTVFEAKNGQEMPLETRSKRSQDIDF